MGEVEVGPGAHVDVLQRGQEELELRCEVGVSPEAASAAVVEVKEEDGAQAGGLGADEAEEGQHRGGPVCSKKEGI